MNLSIPKPKHLVDIRRGADLPAPVRQAKKAHWRPKTPVGFDKKSGDTYSRTFGTTIGSESLTTVFGMDTGVAFQIWSPESSRKDD